MPIDGEPDLTDWEEAVRRSYKASVDAEEYAAKATPQAVSMVAYYMYYTGYDIELLDDTSDDSPNKEVQLFMDFLAMTSGRWEYHDRPRQTGS